MHSTKKQREERPGIETPMEMVEKSKTDVKDLINRLVKLDQDCDFVKDNERLPDSYTTYGIELLNTSNFTETYWERLQKRLSELHGKFCARTTDILVRLPSDMHTLQKEQSNLKAAIVALEKDSPLFRKVDNATSVPGSAVRPETEESEVTTSEDMEESESPDSGPEDLFEGKDSGYEDTDSGPGDVFVGQDSEYEDTDSGREDLFVVQDYAYENTDSD